jgi:hypothetical protein
MVNQQLLALGVKDERELQAKVEKLQELFRVLTRDSKDSDLLNVPETLARVHEFDAKTQAFISTLLVALSEWIAPASAINETDFVCRIVKQMASIDREKKTRLEEEFLDRVRVKSKEKQAKNVAHSIALSRMEMEGCTFKPLKRIPCPDMKTPVPVSPARVRSDKLPTVFDRSPVVARLAVPSPTANRTDVTPDEASGQRLKREVNSLWASSLRRDTEYGPPSDDGTSEFGTASRAYDGLSSAGVSESGRRTSVYGYMPIRTIATQGYVPRIKSWEEDLRGGYVPANINTSPIDFGCRTRLHECHRKSFSLYVPPQSQYKHLDTDLLREAVPIPGIGLSQPEPVQRGSVLCLQGGVHDTATMASALPAWVMAGREAKCGATWGDAERTALEGPQCMMGR